MLGGGGSPAPQAEIAVQLGFAVAALAWVWAVPTRGAPATEAVPRSLLWLGLALLLVPALQLVPLPPTVWHTLPGRKLEVQALDLIGEGQSWRPLSIAPWATLAALLALIPAVGAMWAAASLAPADRRAVLWTIAVVMVAGAVLGMVQVIGGADAFRLYDKSHSGWLTGFHANRNAAADALLIGALALSALRPRQRWLAGALLAFLALAVILTGSRAGMALLLPVGLACAWLTGARWSWRWSGVAVAVGGLAAFIFAANPRIAGALARFDAESDPRLALWRDSLAALQAWWPAGTGLGTYVHAFLPFERAASLDPFFPNRAHNDYLEFAIEAGVLAPILLFAGAIVLANLARRGWRTAHRPQFVFALGTLLMIALHSAIDYPLRNMALACLAGVATGMLHQQPRERLAADDGRMG